MNAGQEEAHSVEDTRSPEQERPPETGASTGECPCRVRARDLGIPFSGLPGRHNAITDVPGVEVGFSTLIRGSGPRRVGEGPVRTGVTVIHPRGRADAEPVFAGWFSLNGNGEMTGTAWLDEAGILHGPVAITNTHSVGTVRDAIIAWQVRRHTLPGSFSLPVVAETSDARLNDMNGFHVRPEHVEAALASAAGGAVAEGNVGGGTAMICHGFKGGTGTSSRIVGGYTLGVLVQANHGAPRRLTIAGAPVGEAWTTRPAEGSGEGSIIVVVGTDAPVLPHQLKRMARRVTLGIGRTGGLGETSSGDLFLAFSTANRDAMRQEPVRTVSMLTDSALNPFYEAISDATEEAIVNALIAAETMVGAGNRCVEALPHPWLCDTLQRYGRLQHA